MGRRVLKLREFLNAYHGAKNMYAMTCLKCGGVFIKKEKVYEETNNKYYAKYRCLNCGVEIIEGQQIFDESEMEQ